MLRVARMASTMTFVVVAVLSWAQCILMEMTLPHGATATISLDVGQTSLSKAQILGDLQGLGEKHGITIIKSVSRPAGIDLVSVGARQPDAPQPVLFMNPALSGTLTNAASLGDASLQGTLSVSALPNASIDDLRSWGKESGIRVSVLQTTQSQRILSVAQRSGGWLALVGVGALTAGVALGWFASRAHSREVRLLAGIRTSRLHVEDSGAIIVSLIVPLLALSAALNLVVLAWRGEANWKVFSEIQVTYVACMIAFAVGVATVLSIATLPRVRDLATRKPPLARFDIVAELVKALSLGLVLAMLPGLLQSSVSAFRDAEARARWTSLADGVAMRVTADSPEDFDVLQAGLVELTRYGASRDAVAIAYDLREQVESLTPFDGLVIANRRYLQAMQIDATKDLKAVAVESLDPALRWDVSESLALWLTEEALTPSGGSAPRWGLYTTATDGGFPSLGGPQAPYIVRSAPLILVVDSATDLAPTVLSSAYASQQLFFTDADILRDGIAATGVGAKVLSIDRVADLAITEAAMANLTAALSALSLLLVLGAVVISVRLSADIYVLNAIRRIVPVRLAGHRWADILSARFVGETILLGAILVLTLIGRELIAPGSSRSMGHLAATLLGAGCYVAYWWLASVRSCKAALHNALQRRV